jgi:hypothetical protein
MVTNKLKQLAAAQAKVAALQKKIEAERARELAGLPARYGFENVKSFIAAVQAASRGRGAKAAGGKKRFRAVITDATRAEVKKLVQAGKTSAEIAKAVGISLPSVHNVKKALGLVESRKK